MIFVVQSTNKAFLHCVSFFLCLILLASAAQATPKQLVAAAKASRNAEVVALLDQGTPIDSADRKGATALIWAVRRDNADLVDVLLQRGADLEAKDKKRRTAVNWAKGKKRERALEVLLFYQALDTQSVAALTTYQQRYANGRYASQLPQQIQQATLAESLEQDSITAYEEYLAQYPSGASADRVRILLHERRWAELTSTEHPSLESIQSFLQAHPDSRHAAAAQKMVPKAQQRAERTRADGRIRVAGPLQVNQASLAALLQRVESLIAPRTLEELGAGPSQIQASAQAGATTSQMQFGNVIQQSISIKTKANKSKTFLSAHRSSDSPPTNVGLWLGNAQQSGVASQFMGDVGKLALRLHDPNKAAEPLGFSRVRLFDSSHEYEYQYKAPGWVFHKLEREADDE
ncbi:MAG: ankyrin repeat domain-containing protein [Pseudomonadales bacterium]